MLNKYLNFFSLHHNSLILYSLHSILITTLGLNGGSLENFCSHSVINGN